MTGALVIRPGFLNDMSCCRLSSASSAPKTVSASISTLTSVTSAPAGEALFFRCFCAERTPCNVREQVSHPGAEQTDGRSATSGEGS